MRTKTHLNKLRKQAIGIALNSIKKTGAEANSQRANLLQRANLKEQAKRLFTENIPNKKVKGQGIYLLREPKNKNRGKESVCSLPMSDEKIAKIRGRLV